MKNKTVIGIVVTLVAVFLIYIGVSFFIAWKATRVSDSILDEFKKVNENLDKTNKQFEKETGKIDQQWIEAVMKDKHPKVCELYDGSINKLDSLKDLLHSTKDTLIALSEGKDDFDSPTDYMIEKGNATKLKLAIEDLISTHNSIRKELSLPAKYDDYTTIPKEEKGPEVTWEMYNFFHLPLAGAVTNLSFLESEILNMQVELREDITAYSSKLK